ncbi:hypothetical protein N7452_004307 [Penicillium brevicompactum]|uniref:Choline monooxygenase, chloroplastic n=1 Tax=Penicillium brevicompactum TaxID=5074 RepID=A0A9W9UEL6_PENBR|nr:hypothetical protein N7452_004307 [Penicillium brevicompactum]
MSMFNYFGLGATEASPAATEEAPSRLLPASWYSSKEIYELERRAIFSRKWLLTTHKLRFPKTGDWLKFNIAGYAFILVKDRDGDVNAFHNICRHRAFPVVTEDGGSSRIFSCQYHGWSYGLNGKLAKAPHYQELEGFDKSKNGLLPIHVHVDTNGFVWLNLDADDKAQISWENDFNGVDLQPRFKGFNFEDYDFESGWESTGEYDWKVLADNYNENHQHHTSNAGPFAFETQGSSPEKIVKALRNASNYYFPNVYMTVSPYAFFMQRLVPTGPTTSAVRYEVYRNKDSSDEDFEIVNQAYKLIASEDEALYTETQKGLGTRVSGDGELQPRNADSPRYFQTIIRDLIEEHQAIEEQSQGEVWPAQQRLPKEASISKEDMDFCSKLTPEGGGCCGGKACGAGPAPGPATAPEIMVS